jgi:hypothetical protein
VALRGLRRVFCVSFSSFATVKKIACAIEPRTSQWIKQCTRLHSLEFLAQCLRARCSRRSSAIPTRMQRMAEIIYTHQTCFLLCTCDQTQEHLLTSSHSLLRRLSTAHHTRDRGGLCRCTAAQGLGGQGVSSRLTTACGCLKKRVL